MAFEITFKQPHPDADEYGRVFDADGRYTYDRYDAKTAAKVRKAAEYLGPWCMNCGKRGTTCAGRGVAGCKTRALKRAMRGFDSARYHGHTLPIPDDAWLISRGYAVTGNGRPTKVYYKVNHYDRYIRTHYAYELAMGRADVSAEFLAA